MSTADLPGTLRPARAESPAPVTTVFLPKEHGSWSLALEPLALGLLVAPSWAGGALAGAALAGFFARRPLKAALDAAPSARRGTDRRTLAMFSVLGAVGLAEVAVLAPWGALWPLLPAAGLGLVFVWFDAQGEARAAASEVAGCAAFAGVPAAFVTLAGGSAGSAAALAVFALTRSVPAVLTVRSHLRMKKGGEPARALPLLASAGGAGALGLVAAGGHAPGVAGLVAAIILLRAAWLLGPWRPAWPAKRLGLLEGCLGLIQVGLLAWVWPAA